MSGMSSPREARSVVMSEGRVPFLNFIRTRSRSSCSRPPWKMPCISPRSCNSRLMRSTASRWLQKTRADLFCSLHSRPNRIFNLSASSDLRYFTLMSAVTGERLLKKSRTSGLLILVKVGISSMLVAEVSIRFFSPGSCEMINDISALNPNSSDLSNSSSTRVWTDPVSKLSLRRWWAILPGVPTTTVAGWVRLFRSVLVACPP